MGPFLSGHNPRLVREGGLGWGKIASQGEETPGPARGSRKGHVAGGQSGSQKPLPQTVPAHHNPRWAGRGRGGAGSPAVRVRSGQRVQISKKEGCGAAAPTSPPPPPKQAAEAGVGAAAVLLDPSCMARVGDGAGGRGWIRGVSQAPCPSHPGGSIGRSLRLAEAQEWPTPIVGKAVPGCSPLGLALP